MTWAQAYRLGLVLSAVLLLWQVSLPELILAADTARGDVPPNMFLPLAILLGIACAAGVLTLHFEERPNVALLALPVSLAWWQLGTAEALLVAGTGALFGNAARLGPASATIAGAARMVVAACAGALAAGSLAPPLPPAVGLFTGQAPAMSLSSLGGHAVFALAFAASDLALDWIDRRLCARDTRQYTTLARTDVLVTALILPLIVVFHAAYLWAGYERQGILLGGLAALLLVIRTYVNLRTLHDALRRLHTTVAEEREKLDTLVTHSGEAIYTVDEHLRISTANPAMEHLLGRPQAAIVGSACAEICHFEDQNGGRLCPDRCPLRHAQGQQSPVSLDVIYHLPDTAPRHILLTYAAVTEPDGRLRLGIGIARDVTAQREAERLREEFVSLVTHELRSPLTSSTGYLDLLKRMLQRAGAGTVALDWDKSITYVQRIQNAERHLLRLVDNLLDIARVERAELALERTAVRLPELLDDLVEEITPQALEKGIRIERAPVPVPVAITSELYLREIMGNLISNAIKYTPDGGRVTIAARRVAPVAAGREEPAAGEWLEISVSDTGYGMSKEDQQRLFTKFFRSGKSEIRKERGTGLGLALSKQMAARLEGDILVKSALGEGSTFTLRVPFVPATPEDDVAPESTIRSEEQETPASPATPV